MISVINCSRCSVCYTLEEKDMLVLKSIFEKENMELKCVEIGPYVAIYLDEDDFSMFDVLPYNFIKGMGHGHEFAQCIWKDPVVNLYIVSLFKNSEFDAFMALTNEVKQKAIVNHLMRFPQGMRDKYMKKIKDYVKDIDVMFASFEETLAEMENYFEIVDSRSVLRSEEMSNTEEITGKGIMLDIFGDFADSLDLERQQTVELYQSVLSNLESKLAKIFMIRGVLEDINRAVRDLVDLDPVSSLYKQGDECVMLVQTCGRIYENDSILVRPISKIEEGRIKERLGDSILIGNNAVKTILKYDL